MPLGLVSERVQLLSVNSTTGLASRSPGETGKRVARNYWAGIPP